jgi:O-antigen/teichoic acid export membrane protein
MIKHSESGSPIDPQGTTLSSRVVKGSVWVFTGQFANRGLQMVKSIVLARILVPDDFGIFGIVTLAISSMETFTQTGFKSALIQKQDHIEENLNTAWTVQVIRGFFLAGILFITAPLFAQFFKETRVTQLLQLLCVVELLRGFTNIGIIYFQKDLEFQKQVAFQFISNMLSLIVGVFLAIRIRNVWALVWSALFGQFFTTILSYFVHPFRPSFHLDIKQASGLFRFGRWVFASTIVIFISTKLDQTVLGRVLGADALGVYAIAYQVANMPTTEIVRIANRVILPAYAKLQYDQIRLKKAFTQVLEIVVALATPLTAFLVFASPQIIIGLFGSQWEAAILPTRILALAGFLRAIAATGGPLFVGAGYPHMDFWMNLGRAITIVIFAYPLTYRFGLQGTAVSVVLALITTIPIWFRVFHITDIHWSEIIPIAAQGMALAILVVISVLAVQLIVPKHHSITSLIFQLILSMTACSAFVLFLGRYSNSHLPTLILETIRAAKK